MSVRHDIAATTPPVRALADVLAAGQREVEDTGGLFGKSDPKDKFRMVMVEMDDQKVEKKVKAAMAKLKPDHIQALAAEFAKNEAKAWEHVAKASTMHKDYNKTRHEKMLATEEVLRAHLGLGTLYKYDPKKHVTVLPNRPELPMLYHSHLWPSFTPKQGTEPWRDYRTIRDFWKVSAEQVAATGRVL